MQGDNVKTEMQMNKTCAKQLMQEDLFAILVENNRHQLWCIERHGAEQIVCGHNFGWHCCDLRIMSVPCRLLITRQSCHLQATEEQWRPCQDWQGEE